MSAMKRKRKKDRERSSSMIVYLKKCTCIRRCAAWETNRKVECK